MNAAQRARLTFALDLHALALSGCAIIGDPEPVERARLHLVRCSMSWKRRASTSPSWTL